MGGNLFLSIIFALGLKNCLQCKAKKLLNTLKRKTKRDVQLNEDIFRVKEYL